MHLTRRTLEDMETVPRSHVRPVQPQPVVVAAVFRCYSPSPTFFMNPHRPTELFGRPFLLRAVPGVTTGGELHRVVWSQVKHLFKWVPGLGEGEYIFELRRVQRSGHNLQATTLAEAQRVKIPNDRTPIKIRASETVALDFSEGG